MKIELNFSLAAHVSGAGTCQGLWIGTTDGKYGVCTGKYVN